MKRIVKHPDIRRLEIMHEAEKLFKTKGYNKTSVEAIIKKAGISKGAFYHYFKSKKDILQALVNYISDDMAEHFNSILENKDLTAIKKLQLMLRGPEKIAKTKSAVMSIIHKPENRELQEELNIQSVKIIAPLIAKVLEQGKKEGIFKKSVSVESVQLMLAGTEFVLSSGLFEWPLKKQKAFQKSIQMLLEQITGAKPGTFNFILLS